MGSPAPVLVDENAMLGLDTETPCYIRLSLRTQPYLCYVGRLNGISVHGVFYDHIPQPSHPPATFGIFVPWDAIDMMCYGPELEALLLGAPPQSAPASPSRGDYL